MAVNSGLSSRFPTEVIFHNMSPANCLSLLAQDLRKEDITVDGIDDLQSQVYLGLHKIFKELSLLPSWDNARDVKNLVQSLVGVSFNADPRKPYLSMTEVISFAQKTLNERSSRITNKPTNRLIGPSSMMRPSPQPAPDASFPPKFITTTTVRTARPKDAQRKAEETASPQGFSQDTRDPGISDAEWAALQTVKK